MNDSWRRQARSLQPPPSPTAPRSPRKFSSASSPSGIPAPSARAAARPTRAGSPPRWPAKRSQPLASRWSRHVPAQQGQLVPLAGDRADLRAHVTAQGAERLRPRPAHHDPAQRAEPLLIKRHRHARTPGPARRRCLATPTLTPARAQAHSRRRPAPLARPPRRHIRRYVSRGRPMVPRSARTPAPPQGRSS